MASSWRITTTEKDFTERASTSSQIIGATVIKSPKGPKDFTFFSKGETQKVLDTFGYPTKEYPSIQDAIDIVSKSAMWISSPYKNGKFGGVFVTPTGTIPFVSGVETQEITDYSAIPCEATVGIGNSVVVQFSKVLPSFTKYVSESLSIKVGETNLDIILSSSGNIESITGTNLTTGSQFDKSTGTLTLVFEVAPMGAISCGYTIDVSDSYFTLFDKNAQAEDIQVRVEKDSDIEGAFDISVYRYNPVENDYIELSNSPFTVGLSETSKNDYGENIFIENVFGDNQLLFTPVVNNSSVDSFIDDTIAVTLSGGDRGDDIQGSDIATEYDALQDTNKYDLAFVFDPTCSSDCIPKFENLRNNYQKHCRFLYCSSNLSASEIIASPEVASGGVTNNRGMYCYVLTWGIVHDTYQGNDFLGTNMGLITGKLVNVLENGGGVPAWIDEGKGVGGILGSSITKLSKTATESELQQLDTLGFNPVVHDNKYGPMIVGWKTRSLKKNVYSSIGQSSLADTLIKLIETSILPSRIGKLIDEASYSAVRMGCNEILGTYSEFLEDYYVLCDSSNNTSETRNQQNLIISIGIVFKGFAEKITFSFVSYRNGVTVEEEIKKL